MSYAVFENLRTSSYAELALRSMPARSYTAPGLRTSSILHGALGMRRIPIIQRRPVGLRLAAERRVQRQVACPSNATDQGQVTELQRQLAEQAVQLADLQRKYAEHADQIANLQRQSAQRQDAVADVGRGFGKDQQHVAEDAVAALRARSEERLAKLKRLACRLEEYNRKQRDGVLGGLLADIVDQVVTAAVLGPGNVNYLSELKEAIEWGEEDSTACARWHTVVQYLEQRSGVSVDVLIANMRPLWECPVRYGSEAKISTADLQQWASSRSPEVKVAVDQLLLILEPLTHPGRPLCPLDQAAINKVFQLEA